jgi:DNA repair photolyase
MDILDQITAEDIKAASPPPDMRRGRGSVSNISGRFERLAHERMDDGWQTPCEENNRRTTVTLEKAKVILTRNSSPDLPFDRSINPYRGCEHGCSYCYARPTHSYQGLSPGLDFESRLFAKPEAASLLAKELGKKNYEVAPIALGTNTDPYQPIEKDYKITRSLLDLLDKCSHPVTIVTKNHMVVRDIDILERMAKRGLVKVDLSVTTLDPKLSRIMEPRASTPQKRLDALKQLHGAGIPTGVLLAPVIPAINDHEIENILTACALMGVGEAYYIPIKLPNEVAPLFTAWLEEHFPDRAARVLSRIRSWRGGRLNNPRFGMRNIASGVDGLMLARRFRVTIECLGLNKEPLRLNCNQFVPPFNNAGGQLALF